MRVLIVEDDPVTGNVLQDFILQLDHDADVVRSAEAALRWLRQERPDLILLDFRLPGMTGLEFLEFREVRESCVPVVVVSGVADEAEVQACLGLGVHEVVRKPVALEHLQRMLDSLAGSPGRAATAERRRLARARVEVPVTGRDALGAEWQTVSVDLSPRGIKVCAAGPAQPNAAVTLSFPSPGGGERFEVSSLLVRADVNGYVFHFANLAERQLERLTLLVRRQAASSRRP